MSIEEREDFLFKMRLFRPDAADGPVLAGAKREDTKEHPSLKEELKINREAKRSIRDVQQETDSEEPYFKVNRPQFEEAAEFRDDVIFEGLKGKTKNGVADWSGFVRKAVEKNSAVYNKWQYNSKDPGIKLNSDSHSSRHHGIQKPTHQVYMGQLIVFPMLGLFIFGVILEILDENADM